MRRLDFCLALCALAVATAAQAQIGGGGGRHGHGGGGGNGGGGGGHASSSSPAAKAAPEKPASAIEIVGVVRAIDPQNGRITIAYEPVDALNWPQGTMPFVVAKAELLQGVTVGEKVRFALDSQQIWEIKPYVAAPPPE